MTLGSAAFPILDFAPGLLNDTPQHSKFTEWKNIFVTPCHKSWDGGHFPPAICSAFKGGLYLATNSILAF